MLHLVIALAGTKFDLPLGELLKAVKIYTKRRFFLKEMNTTMILDKGTIQKLLKSILNQLETKDTICWGCVEEKISKPGLQVLQWVKDSYPLYRQLPIIAKNPHIWSRQLLDKLLLFLLYRH